MEQRKQTAVEWLESELEKACMITAFAWEDEAYFRKLLEQARQREKEQIINAIDAGHRSTYSICEEGCAANMFGLRMDESAEQYYKETYGK